MSKKTVIILVIIGVLLLCTCIAAGVGIWWFSTQNKPAPTITPTVNVSTTISPTTKPTVTIPVISNTFTENFSNNLNSWKVGDYDGDYSYGTQVIQNGVYTMDLNAKDGMYHTAFMDNVVNYENFDASMDLKILSGPVDSSIGLTFKSNDNGQYGFVISPGSGDSDKSDVTEITDWTDSSAILPDVTNHIRIVCLNGVFSFYINGTLVNTVTDVKQTSGEIGLLAELYTLNDHGIFQFDHLVINRF